MDFRKKFEIQKIIYHNSRRTSPRRQDIIKSCYYFTDRKKTPDLNQAIKNLPNNCGIIFREYDLSNIQRELMARQLFKLTSRLKQNFLIGKDYNLALKIKAYGVHFSDYDLIRKQRLSLMRIRLLCKQHNLQFSIACHGASSLSKLIIYKPDIIFLSPIFNTTSHEINKPLGIYNFIKLRRIYENKFNNKQQSKITKFLPLGGIDLQNLIKLGNVKTTSFGAIDFFKNL